MVGFPAEKVKSFKLKFKLGKARQFIPGFFISKQFRFPVLNFQFLFNLPVLQNAMFFNEKPVPARRYKSV